MLFVDFNSAMKLIGNLRGLSNTPCKRMWASLINRHRSPPGTCAQPTPVQALHPWVHSQTRRELYCEGKSTILQRGVHRTIFCSLSTKWRSWLLILEREKKKRTQRHTPLSTSVELMWSRWRFFCHKETFWRQNVFTFYRSILTGNITNWCGSCTAQDRKALQRVVKTAQNIGIPPLSIIDIEVCCLRRAY